MTVNNSSNKPYIHDSVIGTKLQTQTVGDASYQKDGQAILEKMKAAEERIRQTALEKEELLTSAARERKLGQNLKQEAGQLRGESENLRQVASTLKQEEATTRAEAEAAYKKAEQHRKNAEEAQKRKEVAQLSVIEAKLMQEEGKRELIESNNRIAQAQANIANDAVKLESARVRAVQASMSKTLGAPVAAFSAYVNASKSIDFDVVKKCMLIKEEGMKEIVEIAKKNTQYKPGDFSFCGTARENLAGVNLFIAAIPQINVVKIVLPCPLTDSEIGALAKAYKDSGKKFAVVLKDAASQEKYTKALL